MKPHQDPTDTRNGPKHQTGKPCIEPGCDQPAGTAWSPFWCQPCNAKRIDSISATLDTAPSRLKPEQP